MGMYFDSQAILYLKGRLNAEFAEITVQPAKGLGYWQGNSDDAVEFRDVLDASKRKKAPALGSLTLEYFDMTIPDSPDGELPSGSDPSAGKSYKRWILFWKHFRNKHKRPYDELVTAVHDVLKGSKPAIKSIKFDAVEDASARVVVNDSGSERLITLCTPVWHKVVPAPTVPKRRGRYPNRR